MLLFWEKPGTTPHQLMKLHMTFDLAVPLAVETVGRRKGTETETSENTGIRVDQRGWLWGWKATFPRKRYIISKRLEHELVIKCYSNGQ